LRRIYYYTKFVSILFYSGKHYLLVIAAAAAAAVVVVVGVFWYNNGCLEPGKKWTHVLIFAFGISMHHGHTVMRTPLQLLCYLWDSASALFRHTRTTKKKKTTTTTSSFSTWIDRNLYGKLLLVKVLISV
jgi:hypothetical protein